MKRREILSGGLILALGFGLLGGCGDDGGCPMSQQTCSGRCVTLDSDRLNCGACGEVCASGEVCTAGACVLSCPGGQEACDGLCVDPLRDRNHCGGCNLACDPGKVCDGAGGCAVSCQAGLLACEGICVDPVTDRTFCGATGDCTGQAAGMACTEGEVCAGGVCTTLCPAPQLLCDGLCVDPATDRLHCGASGDCQDASAGTACGSGTVCSDGICALSCPAELLDCDGTCIDPLTDRAHCGASGSCQDATAGLACQSDELCLDGGCLPLCVPGELICAGRCVDPGSDPTYCGASGDCAGSNTGESCALTPGTFCSQGTCLTIAPVTFPAATSTDGRVTLSWTLSVTPGFERTRVIRRWGAYPTSPQDGDVVADTGAGVETTVDAAGVPFVTAYYTLFATNADASIFSVGTPIDATGTFVHGTRLCPPDTWLRGIDQDNDLICEAPSIDLTLECIVPNSVSVNAGQTATVTCPAGYAVTGGGFSEIDQDGGGSGDDNFYSMPAGSNQWQVTFADEIGTYRSYAVCCGIRTGISFPGAACPAGEVVAGLDPGGELVCAPALPALQPLACGTVTGPEVNPVSASPPQPADWSNAVCATGSYALGGGFLDIDQDGNGSGADDFASHPSASLDRWSTVFLDEAGTYFAVARCCSATQNVPLRNSSLSGACAAGQLARGVTWEESGRSLVCEAPTLSADLVCSRAEADSTTSGVAVGQRLVASCPVGTQVTGGGFADIDQNGGGTSDDDFASIPGADGMSWSVSFADEVNSWRAYAVCCTAGNPTFSVGD
jgi:hypothetical protein